MKVEGEIRGWTNYTDKLRETLQSVINLIANNKDYFEKLISCFSDSKSSKTRSTTKKAIEKLNTMLDSLEILLLKVIMIKQIFIERFYG